ncbi:hypothetical protein GCM10023093_26750 [Nemorincola caseinilytica]|uniref:Pyrrolo-quinoline quinone repeat domain-containing protein n=1 Tax=Nemorincola caseinilytica TaxID=2054315 RepID=A0ABP8NNE7_9BACT
MLTSCKKEYSPDEVLPVSYSPSIVVGSNNQVLYGINPTTGEKNWELGLSFPVKASPILYKGSVYLVSSFRDSVIKINAKTGEVTKRFSFGGGVGTVSTPIADGNLLYIGSSNGRLYAIDTGTGIEKWSYATNGPIESSPTIHGNNIYVATTVGSVYRFEKTAGNSSANTSIPASPTWNLDVPGARFVSSPAVAEPYMFVGSISDSNMYCIYLDTAVVRWSYKALGAIRSSPAAYGGTCIFGANDFRVYCLDTTIDPVNGMFTPEERWVDSLYSEVTSSPYASNQMVYVGCKDYKLYALRIINGSVKWTFATNGIITSSPVLYGSSVYIGSYDKNLYALDTLRGTLKWKYNVNGQIDCSPVLDDFSKLTGYNSQISGYTN